MSSDDDGTLLGDSLLILIPSNNHQKCAENPPEVMVNSGWCCCSWLSSLTSSEVGWRRRMPFFVEPILVLFFFCEFPVGAINQRYTLDWITNNLINNENDNTSRHHRGLHFSEADGTTCSMNSSSPARRYLTHHRTSKTVSCRPTRVHPLTLSFITHLFV